MTWHERQAAMRVYAAAHGLAPWATADHTANMLAILSRLAVCTATTYIRNSRGERWAVTRLDRCSYLVSAPGRAPVCDTARGVIAVMEAQP